MQTVNLKDDATCLPESQNTEMAPSSQNVISWSETLPGGELVMKTQKTNGDVIMFRLDRSETLVDK